MVANSSKLVVSYEGKMTFPCPRSRLRISSRETGLAVPSLASLLIFDTQAESIISALLTGCLPLSAKTSNYTAPTAIGSVPIRSGHAVAYQWCSLPRVGWHRSVVLKGSSRTGAALSGFTFDQFFTSLSFPTPTITLWVLDMFGTTENIGELCCRGSTLKKNLDASRPSEHPPVRKKNAKTFRWDHRLQIHNLFVAFKGVPQW